LIAGTNRPQSTTRNAGVRGVLPAATAIAALAVGAGTALAGGDGGIQVPAGPVVKDVTCSVRCLDIRTVAETGRIEITGTSLDGTSAVKFPSADGRLKAEPREVEDRVVTVAVPEGADSGNVTVIDSYGAKAVAPAEIEVVAEDAIAEVEGLEVTKAEATPAKSYFNAREPSEVDYLFEADEAADIRIDVVADGSGATVDSIVQKDQKPFANHSVTWDGLSASNAIAPNGDYRFRVSPLSGGAGAAARFSYYDHIFPLRAARHDFGDGLGAGRGHQGQDVFARCGTKIVAARGGTVQVSAYHSAAGNYVVVDGRKTGKDYVYMHMEERSLPREGARVKTGDVIGFESDTGRATGCHLHFELWSAPGWYEGGRVLDPTGPLKKWDRWS